MPTAINPIQQARERLGLNRMELALVAGVDCSLVYQVETGRLAKPSPPILDALSRFGFNRAQLARDYQAWRQAVANEIVLKIASGQ